MTVPISLPRLPLNWQQSPQLLENYWNIAMTSIEKNINAILSLPEIQADIDAAAAAAAAANTAASTANAAAAAASASTLAAQEETSLNNSYIDTTSYTAPLLSVTPAGVITIKTHVRIYGDPTLNPNVTADGGTITLTGVTVGDVDRIYYIDPSRAGGAVVYMTTKDPAPPPVQTGDTHSVGYVTIPATGTDTGAIIRGPGFVTGTK